MSDFFASLLMLLVFAGTWFTLFYVGGSFWLEEASILRGKYQNPGRASAFDSAPRPKALSPARTATRQNASTAAQPARVTRLVPA